MRQIRSYFEKHPKISYIVNFIITIFFIMIFPKLFMPNFTGFIIGLLLASIVIKLIGVKWAPWSSKKRN